MSKRRDVRCDGANVGGTGAKPSAPEWPEGATHVGGLNGPVNLNSSRFRARTNCRYAGSQDIRKVNTMRIRPVWLH